ncbi:MAG: hypothetical protein CL940_05215 [Deltaproteobacteria bacterium]|nr:hypothetical protein [Deltaproteobacteria bacterium]
MGHANSNSRARSSERSGAGGAGLDGRGVDKGLPWFVDARLYTNGQKGHAPVEGMRGRRPVNSTFHLALSSLARELARLTASRGLRARAK